MWYSDDWGGGGLVVREMSDQTVEEMGEDFCKAFINTFLENIDRRNRCDGSREHIPVFLNPHRKSRSSPPVVTLSLEYIVGVPCKAASSGREKEQVRVQRQSSATAAAIPGLSLAGHYSGVTSKEFGGATNGISCP